ncbi:cupin domain-containing protein [Salinibacterium sp. SWN139]|uniref:helix-turn-helix domain-containing protein n=1 Tax=Salinibacterium sp. SWN139 TaxID=2792055 RepID=UPI0018CCD96A|nr:cupin domain-containing protein [Salinibacterium sp. SWN139]MBH0053371.1 cupin domain-containing protein [Salinibacterium sp. SWN139]
MDEPTELLARTIGTRVKNERHARTLTLDQLAEKAGVSRRMLVNVEQGAANPSVGTLLRLSEALGASLPALVEPPTAQKAKVTRAGAGAALWAGENGGRGILLASSNIPEALELWEWTFMPGESHSSEPHSAGTQELLHLLEGEITMTVAAEKFVLGTGDSMAFAGDEDHAYENTSGMPARFVLSVLEPGIGASSRADRSHA